VQRALLLVLIAASYALYAGGPRWTLIPLYVLTGVTVLVAPGRTFTFPRNTRVLDLALAGIVLAIAVQLVPLPATVVGWLSPQAEAVRSLVRFHLPGANEWSPLSVNPDATWEALAVFVLGIMTFWIARGIFSYGGSKRQFCRTLALIGAAAAVSAILFRIVAPGLVHGTLLPTARSANPFGAFINRNHFAGWLLLVAGPVCGYLIAHLRIHPAYRQRFQIGLKQFLVSGAMVTAMAATTIITTMLMTLSRSAAVGLGSAALVGWRVGRTRLRIERTNLPFVLGAAGAGLLVMVLFVDISAWTTRLDQTFDTSGDRSRLTIWRESVPIVRDFWFSGTGAGTFGDAMTMYQQTRVWVGAMSRWAHFNNAHSHYLQVVAEGGALVGIPVAVALISLVRLGRRALRDDKGEMQWARIGAAGGLVGIAVQSIWETALVMPANAMLCGAVAGLLLHQRRAPGDDVDRDTPPELA
jgi:O-antigen ligase